MMFSQTQNTQTCPICNNTSFYKDSGIFYCTQCQTQNDDVAENIFDDFTPTVRYKKIGKIKEDKVKEKEVIGWTSWELYNLVMIGLTNELFEINSANELIKIDSGIKLTILQLWTFYLSKLEVAFTSKKKKCIPRVARKFYKRDVEILYGRIKQRKQKRRRRKSTSNTSASSSSFPLSSDQSSLVSSRALKKNAKILASEQSSSEADGNSSLKSSISQTSSTAARILFNKRARLENKKMKKVSKNAPREKKKYYAKTHLTTQYKTSPEVVTPIKLWSIIYLALRIHNHDIHVSDMLRFSREGHLSYCKLDHLVPPEVSLTYKDIMLLSPYKDITHKGFRRTAASMAKFLDVEIDQPDILKLIERYCQDLALPKGICLYAQKIFLSHPPEMKFTKKNSSIPNYEGRAIAYIIVTLKILFCLDDITEKHISRVTEKINRVANEKEIETSKLFNFCQWQNYIECRKNILSELHYSSKMKYDPDRIGTSHLYLRYMGLLKSKTNMNPDDIDKISKGHIMNEKMRRILHQSIDKLNNMSDQMPIKEMEVFPPSLTPCYSYINQLLENSQHHVPSILCINFCETKIGYMTRPETLIELSELCGIDLEVVDHSIQYFEKIVPPFEQPKIPNVKELNKIVKVPVVNKAVNRKYENLLDYSHRNRLCKMKVNFKIFNSYLSIFNNVDLHTNEVLDNSFNLEDDCFFDQILPDGRLNIIDDDDHSVNDEEQSDFKNKINLKDLDKDKNNWTDSNCLLNEKFIQKYNIKLFNHEKESLLDPSKILKHSNKNPAKGSTKNKKKDVTKKDFKRIVNIDDDDSTDNSMVKNDKSKKHVTNKRSNVEHEFQDEDDISEVPIDCFEFHDSDISVLEDENIKANVHSQVSMNDKEIILRPYKDYWMYHCIFSQVKGKNFELFEKELPENFLWLLEECAYCVEMATEDIYEEVCLIEAYHFLINPKKSNQDLEYSFHNCNSKVYSTRCSKKW